MFDTFSLVHVAAYLGAGLAVGISSIGAGIGEGYIAGNANIAMMKQPKSNDILLRTMLIAQAITETGAIFALVIAMLLLFGGRHFLKLRLSLLWLLRCFFFILHRTETVL
ncbi:MAG: hypothetical protein B1H05_01935 [Candidatus Cloacimonas sp. 4484_140]|nr:MAG: hypothetical protein B1H05_01935 [Candidatus Cloacimonas sp. 4484_140]